jgi:hypothetical protein
MYQVGYTEYTDFDDMGLANDNLVIVSYPHSVSGNHDDKIINLLHNSKSKITLDSVFLGTNLFPVNIDFTQLPNIESFIFSFSKGFGLRYNRIGIMFTKQPINEYELYHSHAYENLHSAQIARKVMEKYNLDYFTDKYQCVQEKACEQLKLTPSDCIHIGLDTNSKVDQKRLITHVFDRFLPQ